ncbi:CRISPR-associated protein Cas4 [Brevundimonas diminuta]|uniref:CRISPR-associated protein Cas4 n=1 Tax=Brevundimonas diminuta TaxID=293 RepID=UPI003D04D2CE
MTMGPAQLLDAAVEDALVPISALQHYLFCPRQCALIHVERLWAEDVATAEGRLLHERADSGRCERRPGVRIARGLMLRSVALGVTGKADVVELHDGRPFPVEYKRGRPKSHRADEVQLCAQAICLEEMFARPVSEGALFYGQTRRRHDVLFDDDLRALTFNTAEAVRRDIVNFHTPPPIATPRCRRCSLMELCQPEQLERPPQVVAWMARQMAALSREMDAGGRV